MFKQSPDARLSLFCPSPPLKRAAGLMPRPPVRTDTAGIILHVGRREGRIGLFFHSLILSYWIILIVYHRICDPLPFALRHCTNPPEHRWPVATVHRINHRSHCVVVADCGVSLSILDLEIFTDHCSFLPWCIRGRLYLLFFFPQQHRAFEYPLAWIRSWLNHPRLCVWPSS